MPRGKLKPESALSQRVSNLMLLSYPKIPFRVDLMADLPKPPMYHRLLKDAHGKWSRGHMDLMIYATRGKYSGLAIELKATDKLGNTEHIRNQAKYLSVMMRNGYYACFCCGYDEAKAVIKEYMSLKKKKGIMSDEL